MLYSLEMINWLAYAHNYKSVRTFIEFVFAHQHFSIKFCIILNKNGKCRFDLDMTHATVHCYVSLVCWSTIIRACVAIRGCAVSCHVLILQFNVGYRFYERYVPVLHSSQQNCVKNMKTLRTILHCLIQANDDDVSIGWLFILQLTMLTSISLLYMQNSS